MKVRVLGSPPVNVPELSIILSTGHVLRVMENGNGIMIMSGNSQLYHDESMSNTHQLRVGIGQLDSADADPPPRLEMDG